MDTKLFWKSIKPLVWGISRVRHRINVIEKGKILKTESEIAESLNSFFSNIVRNRNILRYSEIDSVTKNIAYPTLKALFEYKDHLNVLAIQNNCEKETFPFSEVNIEDTKKEILILDKSKASQHSDIPIKISKEILNIFANFILQTLTALSNHLFCNVVKVDICDSLTHKR